MCVALAALEATIRVAGPAGERTIPFAEFHRLPGDAPERDTNLSPDEIVLSVDLPDEDFGAHHTYLKLRDRLSYAFALVSVAAVMKLDGDTIQAARFALGGVAHKPWRDARRKPSSWASPPPRDLRGGRQHRGGRSPAPSENGFKIELARRAIARGLAQAAAGTPQSQTDKRIA